MSDSLDKKKRQIHRRWNLFWSSNWMWNWRRDRQPCSRLWSGDRNWSCYRRLDIEVPALIFLHLTVETTFLFSSNLMVRFGAKADVPPYQCFNKGRSH